MFDTDSSKSNARQVEETWPSPKTFSTQLAIADFDSGYDGQGAVIEELDSFLRLNRIKASILGSRISGDDAYIVFDIAFDTKGDKDYFVVAFADQYWVEPELISK